MSLLLKIQNLLEQHKGCVVTVRTFRSMFLCQINLPTYPLTQNLLNAVTKNIRALYVLYSLK